MDLSNIVLPSNRKFGLFFAAVFLLLGAFFLFKSSGITAAVFMVLASLFGTLAFLKPDVLLPLNKLWMQFGLLLGLIISPIVMGLIFFVLITPISILMRVFGRDELRINLRDNNTYWKIRNSETTEKNTFKNQF